MSETRAGGGTPVGLPPGPSTPVDEVLAVRRSVRELRPEPLDLEHVGGALRHVAGRPPGGPRAHASARGRYLVSATVVAGAVRGLLPGAYRYLGDRHQLAPALPGDHRTALAAATVDAAWLASCPLVVLLSSDLEAADEFFAELGHRQGERFAWLEAGLMTQNLYLWAAATGLGTVFVGGVDPDMARVARGLVPEGESVLGLLPLGLPRA